MRSRRSTIVTLIAVGSGLIVLLVAGTMLQRPILERWYISRLTARDAGTREEAADRVAEMGSVKAIPQLMRAFSSSVGSMENDAGTGPFTQMKSMYAQKASCATLVSNLRLTARTRNLRVIDRSSGVATTRRQRSNLQRLTAFDSRIESLTGDVLTDANARALLRIAKSSSDAALPRLVRELESESWETRWLAVHVLGELDSGEAAAAIWSMVSDDNEHVRHAQIAARERQSESGADGSPGAIPVPARGARGRRF